MRLFNPFTGQTLNVETPNPKGCNQHTGPNCGGSSAASEKLEQVRQLTKAMQEMQRKKRYSLEGSYQNLRDEVDGRIEFGADLPFSGFHEKSAAGRAIYSYDQKNLEDHYRSGREVKRRDSKVQVGPGLFDREVAAHEIGHLKIPQTTLTHDQIYTEKKAWEWALKNAKKLGLSKRKLERLKKAGLGSYRRGRLEQAMFPDT